MQPPGSVTGPATVTGRAVLTPEEGAPKPRHRRRFSGHRGRQANGIHSLGQVLFHCLKARNWNVSDDTLRRPESTSGRQNRLAGVQRQLEVEVVVPRERRPGVRFEQLEWGRGQAVSTGPGAWFRRARLPPERSPCRNRRGTAARRGPSRRRSRPRTGTRRPVRPSGRFRRPPPRRAAASPSTARRAGTDRWPPYRRDEGRVYPAEPAWRRAGHRTAAARPKSAGRATPPRPAALWSRLPGDRATAP
jgi:hypothetical protein